ncbi:MAG: tetratricopeptide repeat protein, partial [Myxococcota bacterium]
VGAERSRRAARWLVRAERLASAGDRVSALGAFRQAVQIDPTCAPGYAGLARLYNEADRIDDAFEAVRVGLYRIPDDQSLRLWEARLHRRAGDPRAGLAVLRELARSAPNDPRVLEPYLEAAQGLAAWNEALRAARRLNAVEPSEALRTRIRALGLLAGELDAPCRVNTELGAALCGARRATNSSSEPQ